MTRFAKIYQTYLVSQIKLHTKFQENWKKTTGRYKKVLTNAQKSDSKSKKGDNYPKWPNLVNFQILSLMDIKLHTKFHKGQKQIIHKKVLTNAQKREIIQFGISLQIHTI